MKALVFILSILFCSSLYAQKSSKKNKRSDNVESAEKAKADQQAKEEEVQYSKLIAAADAKFAAKDFVKAKEYYSRAVVFKPSDPYPKARIEEIDQILASMTEEHQKASEYAKLIATADALFFKKDYVGAKESYQEALKIKAGGVYPVQKIAEIEEILAGMDQRMKYDSAILDASQLYDTGKFEEAKLKYMEALTYKAEDELAKQRLLDIDRKLAYDNLIQEGDKFFAAKEYEQAKQSFYKAIANDSKQTYPVQKITEINAILQSQKTEKQ